MDSSEKLKQTFTCSFHILYRQSMLLFLTMMIIMNQVDFGPKHDDYVNVLSDTDKQCCSFEVKALHFF